MAPAESMSRRSLSLSLLANESPKMAIVRLVHSCTVQLLQIVSICCARHADHMQLSSVSTFCNLLRSLTVSGHLADSGKLLLSFCHSSLNEILLLVLYIHVFSSDSFNGRFHQLLSHVMYFTCCFSAKKGFIFL